MDQTTDSQFLVCEDIFFRIENPSDIQCHLRLFIRLGNILQFLHNGTVSHSDIYHCFCIDHIDQHLRIVLDLSCAVCFIQRLDQDYMSFIDRRYIITGSRSIDAFHHLEDDGILRILWFDQNDYSALFHRNGQFLCLIVNIDQKKIIQNQILHETVLIHPLLVHADQAFQLTHTEFSTDPSVQFVFMLDHKNIDRLQFITNREDRNLICHKFCRTAHLLNLRDKRFYCVLDPALLRSDCGQHGSFHIPNGTTTFHNIPDFMNRSL